MAKQAVATLHAPYNARVSSTRQRLDLLLTQLKNQRSTFDAHWRDVLDHVRPMRARFHLSDVNRGKKRRQKIIDSTATQASDTLSSGLMSGISSPARPWYRLRVSDPALNDVPAVKRWLDQVTQILQTIHLQSNLYQTLPSIYSDMGDIGTGAMVMEEDFENVVRFFSCPVGSYYLANDRKYRVRIFAREFSMTVRQLVTEFGEFNDDGKVMNWDVFSNRVQSLWKEDQKEQWIDVVHVVEPNPSHKPDRLESRFKKFSSTHFERGTRGNSGTTDSGTNGSDEPARILREAGFDLFPVLAARWDVNGEDVYATKCPGMVSIGDNRMLQRMESRGLQAIDKMSNPPLTAPASMKNKRISVLPGNVTFVDDRDGNKGFRPTYEVNPRIAELEEKESQARIRIKKAYFEDLFRALIDSDRREMTAREVDEVSAEKMLALGPVLERLNQNFFSPMIEDTYIIADRQGKIPPPPEELLGRDVEVTYVSIMANAQKSVGLGGLERFVGFVTGTSANTGDPSILDKVNWDQLVDEYGDMVSVPASIINSDEEVQLIRQERAQSQQQAQMAQAIPELAGAAKDLSSASLEGDSMLSRVAEGG